MALVHVRSKQTVNGQHTEADVDEAWLERWPDDWERIVPTVPAAPAAQPATSGRTTADDDSQF